MRTEGLSPKVVPAIIAALAGAAVTVIGALSHDTATLAVGVGMLGTGGAVGAAGYAASPGAVSVDADPAANGADTGPAA